MVQKQGGLQKSRAKYTRTSSSDSEQLCELKWPHDNLGSRYNNFGQTQVKYRNLDLRLLTAGEVNICGMTDVSPREKSARLKLLGDVLYNSAFYQWHAILRFHAAVLSEIQQGNLDWGEDYYRLEQQMLMPFPLSKTKNEKRVERPSERPSAGAKGAPYNGQMRNDDRVVYCLDYQKKACSHEGSHQGWFFGNKAMLHHICSACFKATHRKVYHSAAAPDCPNQET